MKNFLKDKKNFIWFMRQAGRYLPEYIKIKNETNSFLKMCYTPSLASEITLQPIKRFNFDAAIIFSDILVIPDALGFKVKFLEKIGPKIEYENIDFSSLDIKNLNFKNLNQVYEAIKITRTKLDPNKPLIGFAGAPWTIACYICEQGSSKDFSKTKSFIYNHQKEFDHLIQTLTQVIILHLSQQIEVGCDIIQLFDSWSGILDEHDYAKYVIKPTIEIFKAMKHKYPNIPIIWFPRGSAGHYLPYIQQNKDNINNFFDCLSVDYGTSLSLIIDNLPENIIVQGNLDPAVLLSHDFSIIEKKVKFILEMLKNRKMIFNLGHGILPTTPLENVSKLIDLVRNN